MFNFGNTKEFKNQVFSSANNSGQNPAIPVVDVFPVVASRDIYRNWILLV